MPNAENRDLWFEHQGKPTQATWQEGYSELSLKISRAFDRVKQRVLQEIVDPSATHKLVSASRLGDPCVIDFRLAHDYELLLDVSLTKLVCVPPVVPKNRVVSVGLYLKQAAGGSHTIAAWEGCVFIGPAPSGTPPTLVEDDGTGNALVARINSSSQVLRFLASPHDEVEGFPQ